MTVTISSGLMVRAALLAMTFGFNMGCDGSFDLPDGWEDAEPVEDFIQFECSGGIPGEESDEHASFRGGEGQVLVEYRQAHFRCAQDVEGFYRDSGDELSLLVQPVDMDPQSVAGCSCTYDLYMLVDGLEERTYEASVYRRSDNIGGSSDPVLIDQATVSATAD